MGRGEKGREGERWGERAEVTFSGDRWKDREQRLKKAEVACLSGRGGLGVGGACLLKGQGTQGTGQSRRL